MRVALFDVDSKIVNLALMKLSAFHKTRGHEVVLNPPSPAGFDKSYVSVVFTRNRAAAERRFAGFDNIEFGGTGVSLEKNLHPDIESTKPDYDLYSISDLYPRLKGIGTRESKMQKAQTILDSGIGMTTRGCVRTCEFCCIPKKEGKIHKVAEIRDLLNPRSNVLVLLDANFTADPDALEKLKEIKERKLVVDFTQGLDARLMTPNLAKAFSEVRHLRSVHYAWDLLSSESQVFRGIGILSEYIKPYRHLCFMLAGFDTSHEQDMYRFHKLRAAGVDPYVMPYRDPDESKNIVDYSRARLHHFARWVNGRIYKKCDFSQYTNWIKAQATMPMQLDLQLAT